MEPITLTAIAVGIFLSACGTRHYEGGDSTTSLGADKDAAIGKDASPASVDDIATTDSESAKLDGDTSSYVDVIVTPSPCPSFPLKGTIKLLGTLACGTEGGFISDIDADGNGSCTDFTQSWFFKFDASGITSQTSESKLLDQITTGAGGLYYSAMDGQKGSYGVGFKTSAVSTFKSFPSATISGQTFTPSFGKGVLWYSGKLFTTSSNVSFASGTPKYYPGTVMVYNSDLSSAPTILPTDGTNPTSIGVVQMHGKTFVAVVNSGDYNSLKNPTAPENTSSLTLIDPETLTIQSGPSLSNMRGLGVAGEISSAGTRFVLGSADNSGKVAVVDLDTNTVQTIATSTSQNETHFISMALLFPNGASVVTGDYNTGALRQWDLSKSTPNEVGIPIAIDTNLNDNAGISDAVCMGGKLYVAVGKSIWAVE